MKSNGLIITVALTLNSILAFCQTSIPGGNVSGTWTPAGSPYNVQGSIMIPNSSTLVIQPGVTVNFTGHYKLLVKGSLVAAGNSANMIVFTAANASLGWYGIRVDSPTSNNDSTILSYCSLGLGNANGSNDDANGGALFIKSFSKVRVDHCSFQNNKAGSSGGGIYCEAGSPTIVYNNFNQNVASNGTGGAIYTATTSAFIAFNSISSNTASAGGGIVVNYVGSPVIQSNTITNNFGSSSGGGGISGSVGSSPVIKNNLISNNICGYNGGGIYFIYINNGVISSNTVTGNYSDNGGGINCGFYNTIKINNNVIADNSSFGSGGGIVLDLPSSTSTVSSIISNNVIVNNLTTNSSSTGGAIEAYGVNALFENNTISSNFSAGYGGAIAFQSSSNGVLNNNIIYGNDAGISGKQIFLYDDQSDPTFTFNDIQGGLNDFENNGNFFTGTYSNNISSSPAFIAPSAGTGTLFAGDQANWQLDPLTSPCINSGNPAGNYPAFDIAGNIRIIGGIIDMGAYESGSTTTSTVGTVGIVQYSPAGQAVVYPNPFNVSATIQLKEAADRAVLTVYDLCGKKVRTVENISGKQFQLERENLPPGIYSFELKEQNKTYNGRLLIKD